MSKPLLVEIGTEEIPAGYLVPALEAMARGLSEKLDKARVAHAEPKIYGTPRRLAVLMDSVEETQKSVETELVGPPAKAAFDAEGKPTVAAIRFAEKAGVDIASLSRTQTPKGEYVCARKLEKGLPTRVLLATLLPEVITSIPFPKSMHWADLPMSFARPFHSIVALFGKSVVPFSLNGVKSSRTTRGHFFMCPGKISVPQPDAYVSLLREAFVAVDIDQRRRMVASEVKKAAQMLGGAVLEDQELEKTVTNLVEYPVAVTGKFDPAFLEVPKEVLITAMAHHQKYFAVVDENQELMPCFIAVNNTRARDSRLAAMGHERVLRARLEDAKFFFSADRTQSMDQWAEKLSGIVFQAKLGTMADKSVRIQSLSGFLAQEAFPAPDKAALKKSAVRAAALCKADLVSQVVFEFTNLQGVMGRVYARLGHEPEEVCQAIEEHYRPTYSGGPLPVSTTGAVVAVADKLDSLCGCFMANLGPTGASDPYALRRQGIGVIQILLDKGVCYPLDKMVEKSLSLMPAFAGAQDADQTRRKVLAFLGERMARMLADQGFAKDIVAAATAVSIDDVPHLWRRVAALEQLKALPDYQALATAFKRVAHIISQARANASGALQEASVDPKLFEKDCEAALWQAGEKAAQTVSALLAQDRVEDALKAVAELRAPVDAFFDGVLVMAEDNNVRQNRLAVLSGVADLFARFADFSRIAG